MEKFVITNEDKMKLVAVITSPGFGAGWSTWNLPSLAFDSRLVSWLLNNTAEDYELSTIKEWDRIDVAIPEEKLEDFTTYCEQFYGRSIYYGGVRNLQITFIEQGTAIRITEYDGNEGIELLDLDDYKIL